MSKLISVIVPVYNVEKYLERCLDSVLKQTYSNLEIILVDDGSKDNSGKICDEYAKKDNRIKVIHKENGGISDVRNVGLANATGDYIGFIDSDDYAAEDMFETLYNLIEDNSADISIVSFYEMYNGKLIGVRDDKSLLKMNKEQALQELLIDTNIQSYMWNKLFKKELFKDLKFPVGKNFEDIATVLLIFERANKVVLLQDPKYYYLRRDDSIVGHRTNKTYIDYLEVAYDKYMYLKDKYPNIEIYNAYNYVINMVWVYTIICAFELDEVFNTFDRDYNLLVDIIKKYGTDITSKLDNYNNAVLNMLLLNKDICREPVKVLYKTFKEKRNNGEFDLQI